METLQQYEQYMRFLLDVADKNVKDKFERDREMRRQMKFGKSSKFDSNKNQEERAPSKGRIS